MSKRCIHESCNSWSMADSDWCYWHNPERQQRQDVNIETIADVKNVLAKTLQELRASKRPAPGQISRARAICYLANTLIMAIEKTDLESSVRELEKKMLPEYKHGAWYDVNK